MKTLPQATLIYLVRDGQILLGLKQKKVAAGKRSGYGGKQESGDVSMHHTAVRELFEETGEGISAEPHDMIPQAVIDFTLKNSEGNHFAMRVFIYLLEKFSGEPCDSDEMKDHQWFDVDSIPYDNMLVDNQLYLPKVLNKEYFTAEIVSEAGEVVRADFVQKTKEEIQELFSTY
ncbi:NUDIX domain-containing protein [Patescibacteria group bacterium]|nr:NUDIX domain-containing protein [Patescibacteria group bacterium]